MTVSAQLEGTINRLSFVRKKYNKAATNFNASIKRWPRSVVNKLVLGYEPFPVFMASKEAGTVHRFKEK